MRVFLTALTLTLVACAGYAEVYHVAPAGLDGNPGSKSKPFKTISKATEIAQPGDTVTVHEGVYRERINPPRGGVSDNQRIVYQSASGESVSIKGSEVVKGWKKLQHDTWQVVLPNGFFGDFNPYSDLISGDWFIRKDRDHHTGAVYLNGHWLSEATKREEVLEAAEKNPLWFAEVDDANTTLWAQFKGVDPNKEHVEINVRQSVFYPEKEGINYITVRGFTLEQAATPWAPPTAEQIGLIGTHWSKGWVIENNTVRYSVCTGIALGKHGDEFDNTSANSSVGYVETIKRGLAAGWSKENIGSHVVRNNQISHCEQAGIVGSLGAAFSTISGNEIHDIHMRRLFSGMEMGGIKIHGAIDTLISDNHVYRTWRGIWLDWMAQGARVTGNLLHDNEATQDLFLEVNHGPFLIDNNLFLSGNGLNDISNGDAYAHNLFAGRLIAWPNTRITPYHEAHSTAIAGMDTFPGGDSRFYNNIFISPDKPVLWPERIPEDLDTQHYYGLATYDTASLPVHMAGNVFLGRAEPSKHERSPLVETEVDTEFKLVEKSDGWYLQLAFNKTWGDHKRPLVTSEILGKAVIPDLPYEQPDGTPYQLVTDYFGTKRNTNNPYPGPFNEQKVGKQLIKVWPKNTTKPNSNDYFTFTKEKALEIAKSGLNAGDGYGQVWIRDYNTFIELAAEVFEAEVLKENLLVFFKMQGDDGNIIDAFISKDKKTRNSYRYIYSDLEPRYAGHKNTVETDQETSLIQAVYKYVQLSGDKSILTEKIGEKNVIERLEWAMEFLMRHRYNEKYDLIWGATTADWGDVQPEHDWGVFLTDDTHYAIDIYDNAMFLIALDNLMELIPAKKETWQPIRNQIAKNVREHLWDETNQKFIPHVYLDGSPFPEEFNENEIYYHGGTAVAIEAGILSKEEIKVSLEKMIANVKASGAGSIGLTMYPPYPEGFYKNKSMSPYRYQNGGDWTWFGGRMIQQLIQYGFIDEAYEQMHPMVKRVKDNDGFFEWYTVDNTPKGSGTYRGSAGILYKAILMFEALEGAGSSQAGSDRRNSAGTLHDRKTQ